jgi:hypothetical protein
VGSLFGSRFGYGGTISRVGGPKDPQIPNCQKLLGSFRAPFWMCFMSLFQPVISSEHCMSLGGSFGHLIYRHLLCRRAFAPIETNRLTMSPKSPWVPSEDPRGPKWVISEPLVAPFWDRVCRTENTSSVLFRLPPLGLLVTAIVGPPNGTCCNHWDFNIDSHLWAKKII